MKFRVERDVLADAVAWAARALPIRPSAPVLAGLLIEAGPLDDGGEGLQLSTFDYETSARATLNADVADEGRALVVRPAARRHLPQPAEQDRRDGGRRTQGRADLRLRPLQPADDAGRGLPVAAGDARGAGTVPSGLFANAVSQAVTAAGRDDMLPVLTGVRLEMEGDGIAMLATDRFRLSSRELTWSPGAADTTAAALVPAKVLADTAKSLTGGTEISIALAVRRVPARGSSVSRARPAAACAVRRPGCWTASSPRCARCSRAST